MRKLVERYSVEMLFFIGMLFVIHFVLLGYNLLGIYDFNNLF